MLKTIDLNFLGSSNTIAAYLLVTSDGPVLFETGPYSTFRALKNGVEKLGFSLKEIINVFVTHIHLDHAGAAWALADAGAQIHLHPKGLKHMHDPSRLVESARRIYKDQMESLWSTIKGIPMEQLTTVEHGDILKIGQYDIKAWYTPGHAVHHIAWQIEDHLIAGDVAGIKIESGPVVPPCPPPDINIKDWKASIRLMRQLNLKQVFLTHFGSVTDLNAHFDELENSLDTRANWMLPHFEAGKSLQAITPEFQTFVMEDLKKKGIDDNHLIQYEKANPSWMSVAGLMRYWKKKKEK